jgi:hypothetical protein
MPIPKENLLPSYNEFLEPDSLNSAKFELLQEYNKSLEAEKKHANTMQEIFREELQSSQEGIKRLEEKAQEESKDSPIASAFKRLLKEKRRAENAHIEATGVIKKLEEEQTESVVLYGKLLLTNTELTKSLRGGEIKVRELTRENLKLKEDNTTSSKGVSSLEILPTSEKKEVELLRGKLEQKDRIIKLLEMKVRDNKAWTEELSEDKETWVNRAEHLEKSRDDWIHHAQELKQELDLLEGRMSIMSVDFEQAVLDLNELEDSMEQRSQEKTNDVVEDLGLEDDSCYHMTTCKKCIRQCYTPDAQQCELDFHKNLIWQLKEEVEEGETSTKEQKARILELENFLRERDMQIIEVRNEAARKRRELKLAEKERLSRPDQDQTRISTSQSV